MPPSTVVLPLLWLLLPLASPQFVYPPNLPEDRTLVDYTSGKAEPIRDFHVHDMLIGSVRTPKPWFSITRCAKEGRTEPIYPSNSTFSSSRGHIAPDGTWEHMGSYSPGSFPHEYSAGKNLWIIPNFTYEVGNETTGRICWWETYSVSEQIVYSCDDADDPEACYESPEAPGRKVTLLGGDTENYFASTPFIVQTTLREGGLNYTWDKGDSHANGDGGPTITIQVGNRPTGNAAPRGPGPAVPGGMEWNVAGVTCILCAGTISLLGVLFGFAV
jgi:hypothetical protein